ncbi:MAG: dihydrofolate reductase [Gammaproteobacteria bacterium]|jgi:dihydrofolate reductase|nr:dihydrofolate reductase [Gammaproteobacteria bacterium]
MSTIALIAAVAKNGVIGKNQQIPWHLPADLRHFKHLTWGKTVIMGRHTFESLGKPLANRNNIVLTRDPHWVADDIQAVKDLKTALSIAKKETDKEEIFIIGGSHLYAEALPLASRLYLTHVEATVEGDTYFPEWHKEEWREIQHEEYPADSKHPFAYCFSVYERRSS